MGRCLMSTQADPEGQRSAGREGRGGPPRKPLRSGHGENFEKSRQPGLRRSRLPRTMRKKIGGPGVTLIVGWYVRGWSGVGQDEWPVGQSEGNVWGSLGDDSGCQGRLKCMPLCLSGSGDVVAGPRGGDALARGGPARAGSFYLVEAHQALERVMYGARARAGGSREDDAKVVATYEWRDGLSHEWRFVKPGRGSLSGRRGVRGRGPGAKGKP
jgi:hypothetical protein